MRPMVLARAKALDEWAASADRGARGPRRRRSRPVPAPALAGTMA